LIREIGDGRLLEGSKNKIAGTGQLDATNNKNKEEQPVFGFCSPSISFFFFLCATLRPCHLLNREAQKRQGEGEKERERRREKEREIEEKQEEKVDGKCGCWLL